MTRKSLTVLLFLCVTSLATAVTRLSINHAGNFTVTSLPAKIVLSSDAVSTGNTLSCEIFMDVNGNKKIDTFDQRLAFYRLQDGVGWVRDAGQTEGGIPGDETPRDGRLQTTLTLDEDFRAYSRQTWLVRVTDQDNSAATALLDWKLPPAKASVVGVVQDKATKERLSHALVYFNNDYSDEARVAVTDAAGDFAIDLFPGTWVVSTSNQQDRRYRKIKPIKIQITGHNKKLTLNAEKYKSFIEGRASFENKAAVENVVIALQNLTNFEIYHTRTDENGFYRIGVEPGDYAVSVSQYTSIYLGSHYWPDGFYAAPASANLYVSSNATVQKNIIFKSFPAFIRGVCTQDGAPLQDVLIQGIAIDQRTGAQKLFQTFSKADGSFSLGVDKERISSLVAQKEGGYIAENATFRNIDMSTQATVSGYNFSFAGTASLMSLSGVVLKDKAPAADVCVVAFNSGAKGPDGHLITHTNKNGAYYFDIKFPGDWQIGVFNKNYAAHPQIYYNYMSPGLKYRDLDFALSSETKNDDVVEGELQLADFNLSPHFPNPFCKETIIDFVLPKSSYTQIDVLDMDGVEVTSLLNDKCASGYQKVFWDGADDKGNIIANGVYYCRIKYQETTEIQPITLLR